MKKTIIIDVDGTILEHRGGGLAGQHGDLAVLPGVRKKWEEWNAKGYNIIVLTGRKESMREETERQLFRWHLAYDQLVMGVGGGPRVLINDLKPGDDIDNPKMPTAVAVNLVRNTGLDGIEV
jgi:hypothetical protein